MHAALNYHTVDQHEVAQFVASQLIAKLTEGKKVLWLLSGGSGGAVCVAASKLLEGHDLSNLYVTMSDERYGPVGHPDENVHQLMQAGLVLPGATVYRPLTGASMDETTRAFSAWLDQTSQVVDYRFAVLGIGADAHTCGIKPHSIAVSSSDAAASFEGDDFERITITSTYLRQLDEAVVQAYGESKHAVIRQLLSGDGDESAYPMLAIRSIPNVTVFSDYKEEQL